MKFTNRSTQTDTRTARRQLAVLVIGGALFMGLVFWIIDGILSFYYFHSYLRFLIYTPPQTPLDAIILNVSPYTYFVRGSFIMACLIGGAFLLMVLYRRMAAEDARHESETRYGHLVETMNDGLAVNDTQDIFTYVNDRFCEMLGYTQDELLGQAAAAFVHADDRPLLAEQSQQRAYGKRDVYELRMVRKDSSLVTVLISPQPLYNAAGQFAGSFVVVTDITARKQTQQQELQLALEHERVVILEQLIADISHDFKTPLATIRTSLHLLHRKVPPSADYQRHFDTLQSQSERLTNMVDDLLRLSRLDAMRTLDFQPLDLNLLVGLIVEELSDSATKKQQTLRFDPTAKKLMVRGDQEQLYRAITNIVENALHYTPEGGKITICTCIDFAQAGIDIEDTGIGISPEDLAHVFDRFYRGDRARNSEQGGTGLGLAIAKKVVEIHGGTIEAASELGQGSRFHIRLPQIAENL